MNEEDTLEILKPKQDYSDDTLLLLYQNNHDGSDEKSIWEHSVYQKIKKDFDEYTEYQVVGDDDEDGVVECEKCNKFKAKTRSVQARGGDEGMTILVLCKRRKCRHSFYINS